MEEITCLRVPGVIEHEKLSLFAVFTFTIKTFIVLKSKHLRLDFSKYELLRCNGEKSKNLKKIHSIALGELLLEI